MIISEPRKSFTTAADATVRQSARRRAIARHIVARWPKCFDLWPYKRRPLKLGIHHDIFAASTGRAMMDIKAFLFWYTLDPCYAHRTAEVGAPRVDLDGNPAGAVTEEEAKNAKTKLRGIHKLRRRQGHRNWVSSKLNGDRDALHALAKLIVMQRELRQEYDRLFKMKGQRTPMRLARARLKAIEERGARIQRRCAVSTEESPLRRAGHI